MFCLYVLCHLPFKWFSVFIRGCQKYTVAKIKVKLSEVNVIFRNPTRDFVFPGRRKRMNLRIWSDVVLSLRATCWIRTRRCATRAHIKQLIARVNRLVFWPFWMF